MNFPTICVGSRGINRILAAALVSQEFRRFLLRAPRVAAEAGWRGEPFGLTDQELSWIGSIQSDNLASFAEQFLHHMSQTGENLFSQPEGLIFEERGSSNEYFASECSIQEEDYCLPEW